MSEEPCGPDKYSRAILAILTRKPCWSPLTGCTRRANDFAAVNYFASRKPQQQLTVAVDNRCVYERPVSTWNTLRTVSSCCAIATWPSSRARLAPLSLNTLRSRLRHQRRVVGQFSCVHQLSA